MAADGADIFMWRVEDFRVAAKETLPDAVWQYYSKGDGDEQTMRDNYESFKRYRVLTKVSCDVKWPDTTVSVLGGRLAFPIAIAPTAHHKMAHPDGEKATAKIAATTGTGMILSLMSNYSLEDVARSASQFQGTLWFNLLLLKDPERNKVLLDRAAKAGYKAIVLTVDPPRFLYTKKPGKGPAFPSLPNMMFPDTPPYGTEEYRRYLLSAFKVPVTWDDVDWVKKNTSLPLVLKGILTAEDAKEAVRRRADAILVSNHGGRQLDGVPATIDVLPDIVQAVGSETEVYLDGGVRTGTDVLKALALGARCVFIGRPALWALAYDDEGGLFHLLNNLKEELVYAMARTGCVKIADIDSSLVVHESYFSSRRGNN